MNVPNGFAMQSLVFIYIGELIQLRNKANGMYARRLYEQGRPEYEHHLKTYGHPSEFGYKDFIPMWKAENFSPDALVGLFKKVGAKYFTPCAVHHDNFDLWNSKYHKWNSVNMGPKKDLVGMWRDATLKAGLRFGVTTHLSRSYSWLNSANGSDKEGPMKGVPYKGAQVEDKGLYPPTHDDTQARAPYNVPKAWRDLWANRMKDLIYNYNPDLLYFDCAIPFRGDDEGKTGMDVISHLYNHNTEIHNGKNEAVMTIKDRPWQRMYADGVATLDFERGKSNSILNEPLQTDDSMGSWGYDINKPYTTSGLLIDKLIDIVSKNVNLLLNVPIKADGTLDKTAISILEDMGKWLAVYVEGIYGTRPWYKFGEGPTNEIPHFTVKSPFGKKDIRFTDKDNYVYAFVLDWSRANKEVLIEQITKLNTRVGTIKSIKLLGYNGDIKWEAHPDGLKITTPEKKPNDFAYTFKIEL
ncbi:alpha-L-fucosidase [Mariniflexile sp. AS56]|nr:alpha-L-fucosidase [Mariniflexile sp. AS56]MDO7172488.1 alpha-L-fucosidase [Mariniflexile sp. AS56]